MKQQKKTNAMRILDSAGIDYSVLTYSSNDGKIDGISVADKIGRAPELVYKTLAVQGDSGDHYVCIIPVAEALDLKKAAAAVGEKKLELIPVKDIQKVTGYIRGGCSPLGMKRELKSWLDVSAKHIDTIAVSGGKIGIQIELRVDDLIQAASLHTADLIKT